MSIAPLASEQSQSVTLTFPVTTFPPNSEHALWIRVGIDEIEASTSSTVFDNQVTINVDIPDYVTTGGEQPTQSGGNTSQPVDDNTDGDSSIITIPLIDAEIDLTNRDDLLLTAGILACGAIILWLFLSIIRTLFRRFPKFGNWQPPYATVPPMDPNSTFGRRQLWQPHAQNNTVTLPCVEGQIYPRKLLLGMDGFHLSGWKIKALRMTQYDTYGRVSRSEVLAASGDIRRLNYLARKSPDWDETKIHKKLRRVSKRLAKRMNKKILKRGAQLPIAVDVRLEGRHGEVRIVFELYQCQYGHPQQLDNWEPETVGNLSTMYESYTYTINGQNGNETTKMFRKRLPMDVENTLVGMFNANVPQALITPPIITNQVVTSSIHRAEPPADPMTSTQPVATQNNKADTAEHSSE
jgi:hypothetical protein